MHPSTFAASVEANVWSLDNLDPSPWPLWAPGSSIQVKNSNDNDNSVADYPFDTNQLWLEITNISDGLVCLNLHPWRICFWRFRRAAGGFQSRVGEQR